MRRVASIFAVVAVLAGCGGSSGGGSSTGGGMFVGAGSSFVYPLVAKWIQDFHDRAGTTITYGPIGSGGGIQAITNHTVDFGASDAPLTPDQAKQCGECLQIPWALAGTSIPFNLPGAPKHLRLSGQVLAKIYLGQIDKWDDPAIAKLNPGVRLSSTPIVPLHRSESSGTTFNFTDYLSHVSREWRKRVGTSTAVDFPTGTAGKGSAGVAGLLSRTNGAIGYVDTAYSLQNDFSYAAIRNRAGRFVLPTTENVAAAARIVTSVPPDNGISIVDPPATGTTAYPISTFTYALVRRKSSKAALLRRFLTYAVGPGQHFGPPLEFAPLPALVLTADRRTIARIR
jgi:phosphate transport system substrate-binding protein